MKVIGITGGIGSGKSTVAHLFEELGARVIDADAIAHQLYDFHPELPQKIFSIFGEQAGDPRLKKIDRKKLGKFIFENPSQRKQLESLTHSLIREQIQKEIEQADLLKIPLVLIDAALLVETGLYKAYDGLIVVKAGPQHQIARIKKRDCLSEEEIQNRLSSQFSLAEKLKVATWVIDNSGSLGQTKRQVEELFGRLG